MKKLINNIDVFLYKKTLQPLGTFLSKKKLSAFDPGYWNNITIARLCGMGGFVLTSFAIVFLTDYPEELRIGLGRAFLYTGFLLFGIFRIPKISLDNLPTPKYQGLLILAYAVPIPIFFLLRNWPPIVILWLSISLLILLARLNVTKKNQKLN